MFHVTIKFALDIIFDKVVVAILCIETILTTNHQEYRSSNYATNYTICNFQGLLSNNSVLNKHVNFFR